MDSLDLGGQDSYFTLGGNSSVFSLSAATMRAGAAAGVDGGDGGGGGGLRARFGGVAASADITPLEIPLGGACCVSDDDGSHVR